MAQKANLSFKNRVFYIFVIDEAIDFTFGTQVGYSKAHHRILRKKVDGPGLGKLSEIRGFFFNISATAEASDFKFGKQLGFAKAHHKITCRRKGGHGLGLWKLPNIRGFPFNISATASLSS